MMQRICKCLVLCAFATCAMAAAPAQDRIAADALAQLQAEVPYVGIARTGDRITRLYGTPLAFGNDAISAADNFRLARAEVFGVAPEHLVAKGVAEGVPSSIPLMYDPETGTYKFTLVRYAQEVDGLPVFRADLRVLVRNEPGSPVVLATANLRDLHGFQPGVVPAVPLRSAVQAMIPGLTRSTEPQTVIWAGEGETKAEPRLAITFIGENDATDQTHWKDLFVVDPNTGEIVYRESRIIFTDVSGSVSAMATDGPKSAECGPETMQPMPYATAGIQGGNSTYTDPFGDFVISNSGTSQVTVQSPMTGHYFYIDDVATSEETLSSSVVPPGPVDFVHNSANTNEYIRAQANGYIGANIVRDFVLRYNPSYPVISTDTDFPVVVNRNDFYCPGNAWYDGYALNLCRAGGGYPNTSFSSVIYHEYGHHVVDSGGSGQDQYGEGMGDCLSVLVLDDPVLGYGFLGNCNTGLRYADNTLQYPCSGEVHDCAELLSGCVWDTRNELAASYPDTYIDILGSLTINSVLLHSGGLITPQIAIDFLTLDDTDGDIYNGTPHAREICTGFAAHNMDCPPEVPLESMAFEYPEGLPDIVPPAEATTIRVDVVGIGATPVPDSGQIHYRVDGGAWSVNDMTQIAANQYEGDLPPANCGSVVEWYVSADGSGGQTYNDPAIAPAATYSADVATGTTTYFDDDFETNKGWTVTAGATTGNWERADPQQVNNGGAITQPEDDHTATGTLCYVTGASAGSSAGAYDVDGGPTMLTSPVLALAGTTPIVSYWRWFYIGTTLDDSLVVEVSNDNGSSWVTVETVSNSTLWTYAEWRLADYVTPTDQVRVRFTVTDNPNNSLLEALIDDFNVTSLDCFLLQGDGDFEPDGDVDLMDFAMFQQCFGQSPMPAECQPGDLNGSGSVDTSDMADFESALNGPLSK